MPNLRRNEDLHNHFPEKKWGANFTRVCPPLSEKDYWIVREDNLISSCLLGLFCLVNNSPVAIAPVTTRIKIFPLIESHILVGKSQDVEYFVTTSATILLKLATDNGDIGLNRPITPSSGWS